MIKKRHNLSRFSHTLLCTTALVVIGASTANAGPEGGLTIGGSASIEAVGSNTTIRQSTDRAIIRWDSFDVQGHESVDFQQPSSSSITVNRIRDIKPSQIDGRITANGNIMLLNPNGVVFGAGSQVDVGGIVASTADLEDDAAFMAGGDVKLTKPGNADAKIINRGRVTTAPGGLAGFVAPSVENHGIIEARLGRIETAAGDTATIDFAGDGLIQIAVSDDVQKQLVKNSGTLDAQGGTVIMTAAAARGLIENLLVNDGTVKANTTAAGQKGRVDIKGTASTVQNVGAIEAKGDSDHDGGSITIDSKFAALGGMIDASGKDGGTVAVKAQTVSLADKIEAKGINGAGGSITLTSDKDTWETSTARLNVDGMTDGGVIRSVTAENLVTSGQYSAKGITGNGGSIDITGGSVKTLSAQIDASGATAGGEIRIGGEFQGGKTLPEDELPNAQITTLDRGTRLRADGEGDNADGGTVIVWSDEDTMALGTISATPGLNAGEGGFVEVSSAGELSYGATIETGRDDRRGTVLLDPKNIIIADATFDPTAIIMGRGFTGADTVNLPDLGFSAVNWSAYGVSLDGNRMVVGNSQDNGFGDSLANSGAAYLYSFSDSSFSGGVLEGIIGSGYTGGKNVDMSAYLARDDSFGHSVSLDGNRLAVGAWQGDGTGCGNCGEVYLFDFADSVFTGGAVQSIIGDGFVGAKDFDMTGIVEANDWFGWSVSLDGNRLAVGSREGDGFGNSVVTSGDVHLFSFSDAAFSNPVLEATIGTGYSGGKNIGVALDPDDRFGWDVSLSGNSLAVSARYDRGATNAVSNAGAAYLFSFADSTFGGGVLEGIIGSGYTGGNNIDLAATLGVNDYFATGLSLDNNRLAIGASEDDGNGNASGNSGAVYLYSFADGQFNGGTLEARIGNNYGALGGKNLSRPNEAAGDDRFGHSLSLDGNRLVVGAFHDDGPTNSNLNQGAYHYYTFADSAFTGGAYEGSLGIGYTGGKNITLHFNPATDSQGDSLGLSIDGTRVALGFAYGDGFNDLYGDTGEVHLYNFADTNFDSVTLEGMIGAGYIGGKNIDLSAYLDNSDYFGWSVSLDGNSLSVGSPYDDGRLNNRGNSGAVYNFTFADSAFTGGTLESRMGWDYAPLGGKNINVTLGGSDLFGIAVSLDNGRLAIAASRDDGLLNNRGDAGAVYLMSFADTVFSSPVQQGIIGFGYTGGKNYNLAQLDGADLVGENGSLSLDGNRLAMGAWLGDGFGNSASNSGEVYLFSFADSLFSTATLESTIGIGYTGGKNIDMTGIVGNDDRFSAVALEDTVLAVGAFLDDGFGNVAINTGAVHLFNFADLSFTGGNYDSSIGHQYTGGKNINTNGLSNSFDYLGGTLDIDAGTLIVAVPRGDGFQNAFTDAGEAWIYRGNSYSPSAGFTFSNLSSTTIGITPGNLTALLNNPQDVTLQASNDIFVDAAITANNPSGDAGNLTLQAGRSIFVNANITTDNGNLNLYANEDLATGVVNAQRDAGDAEITMASGTTINAGTGSVHIRLDDGTGKTNRTSGDITLETITANDVLVHGIDQASDVYLNNIITATGAGNPLIIASGRNFINNHGVGALVTPSARWLVYSDEGSLDTQNGLVADFELNECVYLGVCPPLGVNNGFLYEYPDSILRVTVNTDRYYGTANPDNATLQSLFAYIGFQGLDDVSVLDVLPTTSIASSANATANAGTTHAITLSGGSDNFYTYYLQDESLLTITKKPVTASWTGNLSKQYGNANPNPTAANFTFSGFENAQTVLNVTPVANANFGAIDGTTGVGAYNFGVTFDDETNYIITAADGTLDVIKRNITAAWTGALNKIYGDANPSVSTANFTYSDLVNGDTGAVVTASGDFGAIDATTNAGTYVGAVTGNFLAANYNITNAPTTNLVIAKRDITADVDDASRVYGAADPTLDWSNVTWTNLANAQDGSVLDTVNFDFTTSLATSNAGTTHDIDLTGFSDNNYNLTGFTAGTLMINKRDITATVQDQSRAYGDADPALGHTDVTWNNLANLENGSVLDAFGFDFTTSLATSNAGTTHDIDLTGFSDNNYNLTGFTAGTLTIGKRDITATVDDASRAYGDSNPTFTHTDVTWTNLANAQDGSVLDTVNFDFTTALATSNAGTTHDIDLTGFSDNNYNLTGFTAGTLTINKRDITANVNAQSRQYGDTDPILDHTDVTWNNLANLENGSVLDAFGFDFTTSLATSNAGTTHDIDLTGFIDNNYNLTSFTNGTLTINKRDITATVNNDSRVYGDANPVWDWNDVSWNNLANLETGAVLDALTVSAPTALATSNATSTHNINVSGFSDDNYNLTGFTAGTLTINKRDITANVGNTSRFYGYAGTNATWSDVVWNNLANGETGAVLDSITFDAPTATLLSAAGTNHVLDISAFSDNNYNLTGSVAGQLDITQAPLTVNIDSFEREENLPNPVFTYNLDGLRNSDPDTVLSGVTLSSLATDSSPSGLYSITGAGGVALNYFIDSFNDGTLTITSAPAVNQIPATVEQSLTNNLNNDLQNIAGSQNRARLSANGSSEKSFNKEKQDQLEGLMVIPDELANAQSNRDDNILIAITRSLKAVLGI